MELVDEMVEQPCLDIPIHSASGEQHNAQTSSRDLSAIGTHFQRVVELKLHHCNTVDKICSKPNVGDKSEAAVLSLGQQRQAGCLYPPVRMLKPLDKSVQQVENASG
jgi:hypothetical protein